MSRLETFIGQVERRLRLATWLAVWSRHALVAAFLTGFIVLVTRFLTDGQPQVYWVLLPVGLSLVTAWRAVRAECWAKTDVATWLDLRAGGAGALVTAHELGVGAWSEQVDRALRSAGQPPGIRPLHSVSRILLGAAFVVAALWVPVSVQGASRIAMNYEPMFERLAEKLEVLEEQVDLEEEEAADYEERLERLEEVADQASDPESVLEAIADLEESLEERAEQAREAVESTLQELVAASNGLQDREDRSLLDQAIEATGQALDSLVEAGLGPQDLAAVESLFSDWPDDMNPSPELSSSVLDGQTDWGELLSEQLMEEGLAEALDSLDGLSEELLRSIAEKLAELESAGLLAGLPPGSMRWTPEDLEALANMKLSDLADLEVCEECESSGEP